MGSHASRNDLGNLLYRVYRRQEGEYSILTVEVYHDPRYKKEWDYEKRGPYYNSALTFRWQGSEGHDDWYGFRINANRNESLEHIEHGLKLLRRIYRGNEKHVQFNPWEMAGRLTVLGATQVVYDYRTSDLTPIEEAIDFGIPGWYADVSLIEGVESHKGVVIAETMEGAQALVRRQYAEDENVEHLKAYLNHDQPVKQCHSFGDAPDLRPLRQVAQLEWVKDEDDAEE